ncbi:hypothetical protein LPB79_37555 (plasmid) [Rhizobium sp. T136]|nr:hypothetical protein [Rhizobium favelukesii]UFS85730.1 hypothetical protein LPB79_37555 [Rhizobium sp. T136]
MIIGLLAAVFPHVWMKPFTSDPNVQEMGSLYLRTVAPAYGAIGLGLAFTSGAREPSVCFFPYWPEP